MYLRNIEIDLCAAESAFQSPDFCANLARRLERTRIVLADITGRGTVTGALAANMDEEALKKERADLEAMKQSAMMTMMNSIKGDTQSIEEQAKNVLRLAGGGAASATSTSPAAVATASSTAASTSNPRSDTVAAIPHSVAGALTMLVTIPTITGPVSNLLMILTMIDAARSRTEWLEDFASYLRTIKSDLVDARSVFKQSIYYDQLDERITKTVVIVESITSRNRFIALRVVIVRCC